MSALIARSQADAGSLELGPGSNGVSVAHDAPHEPRPVPDDGALAQDRVLHDGAAPNLRVREDHGAVDPRPGPEPDAVAQGVPSEPGAAQAGHVPPDGAVARLVLQVLPVRLQERLWSAAIDPESLEAVPVDAPALGGQLREEFGL